MLNIPYTLKKARKLEVPSKGRPFLFSLFYAKEKFAWEIKPKCLAKLGAVP